MNKIRFYVCPTCGAVVQAEPNVSVSCCGKQLEALKAQPADEAHTPVISQVEDERYFTLTHGMTKEHFIAFVAYVRFDYVYFVRLYPEQDAAVRLPKGVGGSIYYCCSRHGLFEHRL